MALDTIAVIPARYGSTRLPGKPLISIAGTPLILRVLHGVQRCKKIDRVIVATDDERIADVVRSAGGEAMMTPSDLPTGGDRVAYVAREIPSDIVINVQGDDPLVGADMLDPLIATLEKEPDVQLALLLKEIEHREEAFNPNVVKAVFDANGHALYFSRSPIPYPRNEEHARWFKHIGPYGWRREFLLEFSSWAQTPLESSESLEMLRVLEKGYRIKCVPTMRDTVEIDTPEDLKSLEKHLAENGDENA